MGLLDIVGDIVSPAKAIFDLGKSYIGNTNSEKKAIDDLRKNRPNEQIPQAAIDAFNLSKQLANSDMPGYVQAKQDIGSSTAQATTNLEKSSNSVSGTLGGIADIYGKQQKSLAGLDVAQAQYKQQQQQALVGANEKMADWQQQQENWNVLQKYGEDYNFLQSQLQSANANMNQREANLFGLVGSVIKADATFATGG
jgi:hypothetical protein